MRVHRPGKNRYIPMITVLGVMGLIIIQCKIEPPVGIWPPDETKLQPNPVILRVDPPTGTLSGIGEVVIVGENFSTNNSENQVYIGSALAATIASTDTMITISTPVITGDSLDIKVAVIGAQLFAVYSGYKLEDAVVSYGDFGEFHDVYGLAMDTDGNLYLSLMTQEIIVVSHEGVRSDVPYGTTSLLKMNAMKWGPDSALYCTAGRTTLYRIPPGGGADESFVTIPNRVKVNDLDFGPSDVIYTGGKDSTLFRVTLEGDIKTVATYPAEVVIISVRVYNGHVYVAGKSATQEAIWRNAIISADSLGSTELVFDWGQFAGEEGPEIQSITFAADGDMYIGADKDAAIFVLSPPYGNSIPDALYPKVLKAPANVLCWGNDQYLYVNHRSLVAEEKRIFRVSMQKAGAPYYGRQ